MKNYTKRPQKERAVGTRLSGAKKPPSGREAGQGREGMVQGVTSGEKRRLLLQKGVRGRRLSSA